MLDHTTHNTDQITDAVFEKIDTNAKPIIDFFGCDEN